MTWMIINVLFWSLVIFQMVLLIALARVMGGFIRRFSSAVLVDAPVGPRLGELVPEIPLMRSLARRGSGNAMAILFVIPRSPESRTILSDLTIQGWSDTRVQLVIVSGNAMETPEDVLLAKGLAKRDIPYVVAPVFHRLYGVSLSPYAAIIDSRGHLAEKGIVSDLDQLQQTARDLAINGVESAS